MKKIIIASKNQGKIKEFKALLGDCYECFSCCDFTNKDIDESASTFKENALLKARGIYELLDDKQKDEFIVLSDDSGLCVEALNNEPGVFSARYCGENSTDLNNRKKLISKLKELNIKQSKARFEVVIALCSKYGEFYVKSVLKGCVVDYERGENGFGYDSLFIPASFDKSLAELSFEIKNSISHRAKALKLMKRILKLF